MMFQIGTALSATDVLPEGTWTWEPSLWVLKNCQPFLWKPGSLRGPSAPTYCIPLDWLRQKIKVPRAVIDGETFHNKPRVGSWEFNSLCFKYSFACHNWVWHKHHRTRCDSGTLQEALLKMILLWSFSGPVYLLMEANILRMLYKMNNKS